MLAPRSRQSQRLAATKHSNTDPDVMAVTVMLSVPRITVESTVDTSATKWPACFARPAFGLDRLFAAIGYPVGKRGQAFLGRPPNASLSKLIFDRALLLTPSSTEGLKRGVNEA